MRIFDLHCDTPYRMYTEGLSWDSSLLDTPIFSLKKYGAVQVTAFWSDNKKDGEQNYKAFFETRKNLLADPAVTEGVATVCTDRIALFQSSPVKLIWAVEGAELLCGKLQRLYELYDAGVRVLCPMWRGTGDFGGAHDTDIGLTATGKELVAECERLGIIIDTSHMSEKAFWDTAGIARRPFIASHSNSLRLCPHPRNLSDTQLRTLFSAGGIVGANLYPPFISKKYSENSAPPKEYFDGLCRHILHFLSLGGEKNVCIGADRDGFERIDGYSPLCFAEDIYSSLIKHGIDEKTANDIFFGNAFRFFSENLP